MARKSLSEIVEACENTEIEAEPSLESENAYRGKDKGELSDENKAAIARIVNGE